MAIDKKLPDWFKLTKYVDAAAFSASEWVTELFERHVRSSVLLNPDAHSYNSAETKSRFEANARVFFDNVKLYGLVANFPEKQPDPFFEQLYATRDRYHKEFDFFHGETFP